MRTFVAKPAEIERKWYVVDAEGQTLGRLSTVIARVLIGKNKPEYTPGVDTGDYVIVVNADKVVLSGNKAQKKTYFSHSGYPGGMKQTSFANMMQKRPERVVELAVKGMLPKNALGRAMYKKLKVFAGPDHEHAAQQPVVLDPKA